MAGPWSRSRSRDIVSSATVGLEQGRREDHVGAIATAPQTITAAPFTVRPLSPALGAGIRGGDLRDPIDEALRQTFLDAWHQYLVILLRNQTLDEDTQVRFAEMFGPPAPVTSGRSFSVKHPAVMLISNIRQDGKPIGA